MTTPGGTLTIQPITHATLQIMQGNHVILVDPTVFASYDGPYPDGAAPPVNYDGLKPPTVILVTDIHGDHLDPSAIATLKGPRTTVLVPAVPGWQWFEGATPIANGQTRAIDGVSVLAVPMYNLQRGPSAGQLFHTKGRGNGYVIAIGGTRVYVAGDTECTPEMRALKNIDVAFLPMNLPYTMTPAEAAACAKAFTPRIVYPITIAVRTSAYLKQRFATAGSTCVFVTGMSAHCPFVSARRPSPRDTIVPSTRAPRANRRSL